MLLVVMGQAKNESTNACKEHIVLFSLSFIFLYGLRRCIKLLLNLGYLLSASAESIEQLLLCVSSHSPLSLSPRCLSHAYRLSMLFAACQRGQKRLYAQNSLSECFSTTTHFSIFPSFCLLWSSLHSGQIFEFI